MRIKVVIVFPLVFSIIVLIVLSMVSSTKLDVRWSNEGMDEFIPTMQNRQIFSISQTDKSLVSYSRDTPAPQTDSSQPNSSSDFNTKESESQITEKTPANGSMFILGLMAAVLIGSQRTRKPRLNNRLALKITNKF